MKSENSAAGILLHFAADALFTFERVANDNSIESSVEYVHKIKRSF